LFVILFEDDSCLRVREDAIKNVPLLVNLSSITFQNGWKTFHKRSEAAR